MVLADGFYEWKRTGKSKVPYRIALKTEEPFAFAGIWSMVHDAQGAVHLQGGNWQQLRTRFRDAVRARSEWQARSCRKLAGG